MNTVFKESISGYGIFDLSGNVWEWTDSWSRAEKTDRVLRGGSWGIILTIIFRCAYRVNYPPDVRYDYFGFRVVCSAQF